MAPANDALANGLKRLIRDFQARSFAFPNSLRNMQLRVFELFAAMVTNVPAQCILKALDIECQMLKSDVEHNRLPLPEDAFSIFYFREFVHAAKVGRTLGCNKPLPPDHVEFFKKTINRLVQSDELPHSAVEQFENALACRAM